MNTSWFRELESPGSAYRGKPFWAWNGRLDPDELRRQVRLMRAMGLGGFFMHSRVGLATAYLSPDWFRCVNACVDEARRQGMEAWLYDEDRWPSGAAGGLVTCNPRYRMRNLELRVLSEPGSLRWTPDTVAAFTARLDGPRAEQIVRVPRGRTLRRLARGESLLVFSVQVHGLSDWYNGYTYLDTLNPEAVAEFIRVTHEAYRRRCGTDFGGVIPGIFTDEPYYGYAEVPRRGTEPGASVPWTDRLPVVFRRRYGYDLLGRLPAVFFDVAGQPVNPVRYHFYDCLTHLFVEAFARQIGEWCGRYGLQFTGHLLSEDTLSEQATRVGSVMRAYEHMQAPGMDLLTERWRIYDVAKQVASAARQFGRKWRLTETYGCTGWDFPFEGHKALGDWQVALGINLRCQHLAWYTMEGEAKRDYPAGIFYQSPWWRLYTQVEDYFARVLAVMTRGEEVRDLLVVHPVESMWVTLRMDPSAAERQAMNGAFVRLRDGLLSANLDFDYGDEEILGRRGRVRRGRRGPRLTVGRAAYKAVLVPPLKTIRASTVALLRRFRAAGGEVVFAGAAPDYVDARPSRAAHDLAAECRKAGPAPAALAEAVAPLCRRISVADGEGREIPSALHLLREDAEAFYLFLCNTSLLPRQMSPNAYEGPRVCDRLAAWPDVTLRGFEGCRGRPLEVDPGTGAVYTAKASPDADGWRIRTSLPRLGSRLFVVPKRRTALAFPARPKRRQVRSVPLRPASWRVTLSESNGLVLDRPRFRLGEGAWQGPDEILRVDRAIREAMGMKPRGGAMKQPWARPPADPARRQPFALRYAFDVADRPSGDLHLALEQPARYAIHVNGQPLTPDAECGWWVDRSLRKLALDPALLREGGNVIELAGEYTEDHPGLEIVYLLGTFGARVRGWKVEVTRPATTLRLGDWTRQGLPFYSGSVTYWTALRPSLGRGERLVVAVPEYRGATLRVWLNGQAVATLGWDPYEADITDFVARGVPAELGIEVIGHRRNSHGPHHIKEKWPGWTGPGEYVPGKERWFDGYQLVPCGLMAPPRLSVRR